MTITTWAEFWEAFHALWGRDYDQDRDKPIWRAMQSFLEHEQAQMKRGAYLL